MAFGKDPEVLQQTGSFRQRANSFSQTKSEQRGKGGGGGLYFVDEYKPSVSEPDTIRILDGHYQLDQIVGEGDSARVQKVEMPFFQYVEHFDGRHQKSCICSAGPWMNDRHKRQPCYGCDIYWEARPERGADGKRPKGRMSRSEKYVFPIIDYGLYHFTEDTDKNGVVRVDSNTNKPYMKWVKCEGTGCAGCRGQKETKRGHTRRWGAGWKHYSTILTADAAIGKSCRNCGGDGTIRGLAWLCGNVACGECLIDLSTTSLKQADIDNTVSKAMNCRCGYVGFPMEMFECQQCTPIGGRAQRATIFDVDMQVQRIEDQGEGNGTTLFISRWSPPRAIDQNFVQYAKPPELSKVYTPTSLENQAQLFQVKGPAQAQGETGAPQGRQPANTQARPYSEAGNLPPAPGMAAAPMGLPAGSSPHAQPYAPPNPYGGAPAQQPPQQQPQYAPPFAPQYSQAYPAPPPMQPYQQPQYQAAPPQQPPPQYQQPQYQAPPPVQQQQPYPQQQAPAAPPPGFGGMMPPPRQ